MSDEGLHPCANGAGLLKNEDLLTTKIVGYMLGLWCVGWQILESGVFVR